MATRSLVCKKCASPFEYLGPVTNGVTRKYCSDFCRTQVRHQYAKAQPLCVVEGCPNQRQYKSGICNSCYYRLRRSGTLDRKRWAYRALHSQGYVLVYDKTHLLCTKSGYVMEHRKILYDSIGAGPHSCYWCRSPIDWNVGKCVMGSLVPDHLDGDKKNNSLNNLVPACNRCNATRGLFQAWVEAHSDDPWLRRVFNNADREKRQFG